MSIGLTAGQLNSRVDTTEAKEAVQNECLRIDEQIMKDSRAGLSYTQYTLSSFYYIGAMNREDAQLYVYTELLKVYNLPEAQGGKGFSAKISFRDGKSILFVKWNSGMSSDEKNRRKNYLNQYLL